ncbi:MAG: hypothetical protein KGY65_03640 [Candidatus Thermoplasmatota archaeon]|nr:hypothetical protein [Candidatus Thermoplasmatota archaeon]
MNEQKLPSVRYLPAQKILPKDDAFHGSKYILDIEWWYFDAVFENGLSAHIGFRLYHIREIGVLQARINLYKHGTLIKEKIHRFFLSNIIIDKEKPIIIINGKKVVSLNIDKKNQNKPWMYTINLSIEDVFINLIFTSLSDGWKIETDSTCWTVPLPKANVTGTISFEGKTEKVKGSGYHDHNWGYSPTTVIQNFGWYWGRITAEKLHVTWANTIISKTKQDLITVVNKPYLENNEPPFFTSIHPNEIKLKTKNYKKYNNFLIPQSFKLIFNQQNTSSQPPVSGKLTMNTIDIHYDKIFIINYWRYHVNVSGTITYGSFKETLKNKSQIIEYLRF